jgi:hypothetical protein
VVTKRLETLEWKAALNWLLIGALAMSGAMTVPRPTAAASPVPSVPGEERHAMRGVTWDFYDRLTDALGEHAPFRVAYDGKDIEIMTLGPKHEGVRDLLNLFVNEMQDGLEEEKSGNRTQWKKRLREWVLSELKPRVESGGHGT